MRLVVRSARPAAQVVLAVAALLTSVGAVQAFEEPANEKQALHECGKQVCELVVKKEASGSNLTCGLSKTWSKEKIRADVEKKKLKWGFGDARCALDLSIPRAIVVDALTKPAHTLAFPQHTIKCEVEGEKATDVTTINVTVEPRIEFKDGKAVKAFIGLKDIQGPAVVKGAIWTVAAAEDYVGLFHSDLIAEINDMVGERCPKSVGK